MLTQVKALMIATSVAVKPTSSIRKLFGIMPVAVRAALPTLRIRDFDVVTVVEDDKWNHVVNGERSRQIFTKTTPPKNVGVLRYRLATGQIGWLNVDSPYRGQGLEQQLVKMAVDDIQDYGVATTVWEAFVSKNDPLYASDPRFTWTIPAHPDVTSDGWSMDL